MGLCESPKRNVDRPHWFCLFSNIRTLSTVCRDADSAYFNPGTRLQKYLVRRPWCFFRLLLVQRDSFLEFLDLLYISSGYTPFDTHDTMGWKNVNTIIEDKLLLGKCVACPPLLSDGVLLCD